MNLKTECWELVHGADAYVSILGYHIETCTKKLTTVDKYDCLVVTKMQKLTTIGMNSINLSEQLF